MPSLRTAELGVSMMVSLAETAVAVSGGRLLAPDWPGSAVQHEPTLPR